MKQMWQSAWDLIDDKLLNEAEANCDDGNNVQTTTLMKANFQRHLAS